MHRISGAFQGGSEGKNRRQCRRRWQNVGSNPGSGRYRRGGGGAGRGREMATYSSIFAWRIPWTQEPGGLQSTASQRGGEDWKDWACMKTSEWGGKGWELVLKWPRSQLPISSFHKLYEMGAELGKLLLLNLLPSSGALEFLNWTTLETWMGWEWKRREWRRSERKKERFLEREAASFILHSLLLCFIIKHY